MSLEGNHPRAAIVAQADTRSQAGADVWFLCNCLSVDSQCTNFGDPRIALDHLLLILTCPGLTGELAAQIP